MKSVKCHIAVLPGRMEDSGKQTRYKVFLRYKVQGIQGKVMILIHAKYNMLLGGDCQLMLDVHIQCDVS